MTRRSQAGTGRPGREIKKDRDGLERPYAICFYCACSKRNDVSASTCAIESAHSSPSRSNCSAPSSVWNAHPPGRPDPDQRRRHALRDVPEVGPEREPARIVDEVAAEGQSSRPSPPASPRRPAGARATTGSLDHDCAPAAPRAAAQRARRVRPPRPSGAGSEFARTARRLPRRRPGAGRARRSRPQAAAPRLTIAVATASIGASGFPCRDPPAGDHRTVAAHPARAEEDRVLELGVRVERRVDPVPEPRRSRNGLSAADTSRPVSGPGSASARLPGATSGQRSSWRRSTNSERRVATTPVPVWRRAHTVHRLDRPVRGGSRRNSACTCAWPTDRPGPSSRGSVTAEHPSPSPPGRAPPLAPAPSEERRLFGRRRPRTPRGTSCGSPCTNRRVTSGASHSLDPRCRIRLVVHGCPFGIRAGAGSAGGRRSSGADRPPTARGRRRGHRCRGSLRQSVGELRRGVRSSELRGRTEPRHRRRGLIPLGPPAPRSARVGHDLDVESPSCDHREPARRLVASACRRGAPSPPARRQARGRRGPASLVHLLAHHVRQRKAGANR